jgi:hypothetical protein
MMGQILSGAADRPFDNDDGPEAILGAVVR